MDSIEIAPLTDAKVDLWIAAHEKTHVPRLSRFWYEAKDGARVILVAWRSDRPVGHVTLLWRSAYPKFTLGNIPEIVDLWVMASYRRHGIGARLLQTIEQIAYDRKCKSIGLGVGVLGRFGPAQRLYARAGYLPDGTGLWAGGVNIVDDASVWLDDAATVMLVKDL